MSGMNLYTSIAAALLLFWAWGAYNRLTRLKGDLLGAFGLLAKAVESRSAVQLRMLHARILHSDQAHLEKLWSDMEAAVQACASSAALAALNPADDKRVHKYSQAENSLARLMVQAREQSQDLAGAPWPADITAELTRSEANILTQREAVREAIARHNEGVAQWPAALVASLFGMRRAAELSDDPGPTAPAPLSPI
jgi:LemA protein